MQGVPPNGLNMSPIHQVQQSEKRHREDTHIQGATKKKQSVDTQASNISNLQDYYGITVSNMFSGISEEDDVGNAIVSVKVPPIFVSNVTNLKAFNQILNDNITSKFTTELKFDKIKINIQHIDDFRNAVKFLKTNNIEFYSFEDPSNKKFSVIVKNIHTCFSEADILEDLQTKFTSIQKVTRLHKDSLPIPVVALEFSGAENMQKVLDLNYICGTKIKIERRKVQGPIQCNRCLSFWHTKNNCNYKFNCAFCAKNHFSAECPNKNELPKCFNCKGTHKGDSRNDICPYYQKVESASIVPRNSIVNLPSNNPPAMNITNFPSLPVTNPIPNFPQKYNTNTAQKQSTSSNNNFREHETPTHQNTQSNNLVEEIINKVTSFITNLIKQFVPHIISSVQTAFQTCLFNNNGP